MPIKSNRKIALTWGTKNGDDDESTYLYLVTNDIDLSFNEALEIYKKRWKIEECQGLPLEGINHLNRTYT